MNKNISYLDLLNMVKEYKYPFVYYVAANGKKFLYRPEFDDVDNSFLCYMLADSKQYNTDYARYYLPENILESEMIKENLEIAEFEMPKPKVIDPIKILPRYTRNQKVIMKKINEIIKYINNTGEK